MAVALAVRLVYLLVFGGLDNEIHDSLSDQYIYLDIAGNLAAGNGFTVSTEI